MGTPIAEHYCFCCGLCRVKHHEDLCPDCERIFERYKRKIFVFGSNSKGIHESGAAKAAVARHGAIFYRGTGFQGDSYAIPTKDDKLKPLPLFDINYSIVVFNEYVKIHKELLFIVTKVGCGAAGYKTSEIRPMFQEIFEKENVLFDRGWQLPNPLYLAAKQLKKNK